MKTTRILFAAFLIVIGVSAIAEPPRLTCIVSDPLNNRELTRFTNVFSVTFDHEKKVPPCCLIRYIENAKTNEFHAWMVNVTVITNKVARKP